MKGFISYSHEDINLCKALLTHLKPFEMLFDLTFYVDQRTETGWPFDAEVNRWIEEASLHILMISPYSMDSPAIMDWELPAIRKKENDMGDLVLPLVVRNCRYGMVTSTLLASPRDAKLRLKPVTKWSPHSEGLHQASLEFEAAIRKHFPNVPNPVNPRWEGRMTGRQDLTAAVAQTLQSVDELKDVVREFNVPKLHTDLTGIIALAGALHERHTPEPQNSIADDYAGLRSNARMVEMADINGAEAADRFRRLRGALGNLHWDITLVLERAADLGLFASGPLRPLPDQPTLDRVGFENQIDAMLAHARAARRIVDDRVAPEAEVADQPPHRRAIIRDFVQEYHVTDSSVRLTINIGEGIDLAVLERGIAFLASSTREMSDTVKVWVGVAGERIQAALTSVRASVRKLAGSMSGVLLRIRRGRRERITAKKDAVAQRLGKLAILVETLGKQLDDAYWNAEPEEIIALNLMQLDRAHGHPLTIESEYYPARGATLVTVMAADHPGLLFRIAGGIHLADGHIIDARIHTAKNGMAVDNFLIQDPLGRPFNEGSQIERLTRSITDALANRVNLSARPQARRLTRARNAPFKVRPRVEFDNLASERFTVVEVSAHNRPALLYRLTQELFQSRLIVHSAHVAAYGKSAFGTFYVTDLFADKVETDARLKAVERRLLKAAEEETV